MRRSMSSGSRHTAADAHNCNSAAESATVGIRVSGHIAFANRATDSGSSRAGNAGAAGRGLKRTAGPSPIGGETATGLIRAYLLPTPFSLSFLAKFGLFCLW